MARGLCTSWSSVLAAWLMLAGALGCEGSHREGSRARDPSQLAQLRSELRRLAAKVEVLEQQLQKEHRAVATERLVNQEQRDRLSSLEASATGVTAATSASAGVTIAGQMTAEAELKQAYLSLMRAIERMDISAEEKAALKNNLRPTRTLDAENPWATARH